MNKYFKYSLLVLITLCFFSFCSNVNAETLNATDIPNSTYVIGSHMFDRNTNEETGYNGQLTTQLIMLASSTVNNPNMNNMIIFYKNPRGNWVNALSGEAIEPPTTFNINYKNLSKEIITPAEPILYVSGPDSYDSTTGEFTYTLNILIDDINNSGNTPDGVWVNLNYNSTDSYEIFMSYEEDFSSNIMRFNDSSLLEGYNNILLNHDYTYATHVFKTKAKPNGRLSDLNVKAYNLDAENTKIFSNNVSIHNLDGLPMLTIESNYITDINNYSKYSVGVRNPFTDTFLNAYLDDFVYVLEKITDIETTQIGTYSLDELANLSINSNTLSNYKVSLACYINSELYFPSTETTENNTIIIDTRKLTTPTWMPNNFENDFQTTYININSVFYTNQAVATLDHNVEGTEIYEISYPFDYTGTYKFIKNQNYIHANPSDGIGAYVARVYVLDSEGNKIYSDFSDKNYVVKYPTISTSNENNGDVTVTVTNSADYKKGIYSFEIYTISALGAETLIGTIPYESQSVLLHFDENTEIYARTKITLGENQSYFSSKSNSINVTI